MENPLHRLLTARGGVPVGLAIIPALWGFIGGSAAVLLAVRSDYVLLFAGIVCTVVMFMRATHLQSRRYGR